MYSVMFIKLNPSVQSNLNLSYYLSLINYKIYFYFYLMILFNFILYIIFKISLPYMRLLLQENFSKLVDQIIKKFINDLWLKLN